MVLWHVRYCARVWCYGTCGTALAYGVMARAVLRSRRGIPEPSVAVEDCTPLPVAPYAELSTILRNSPTLTGGDETVGAYGTRGDVTWA
eukprot:3262961-Rhodomonas_salina.2